MDGEKKEKVDHKSSSKKSKKSKKKIDLRKIADEPETTNQDLEDNTLNHNSETTTKLTKEEEEEERQMKFEKVKKCYLEGGLCCAMLLIAAIFIYLFEFTDVIRQRPDKIIYTKDLVIEKPLEYEIVFLEDKKICMLTLTEAQEIANIDPQDFTEFGPEMSEGLTREQCEGNCMKVDDCTFYQYHYITDPPLLATKECMWVKNTTAPIIGTETVPPPKIVGTNDVYSCWVKTNRTKEAEAV